MRGTASIAIAVTPRSVSAATRSGLRAGASRQMTMAPGRSIAISSVVGELIPKTMSLAHTCARAPMLAPAASKAASEWLAARPAPDSTSTS